MTLADNLTINDWPLAYAARLEERSIESIDLVVMHCTELPDLATARAYAERIRYTESQTGDSGHYYVDRDGSAHRFVTDLRIAHHVHGYNKRSIGVELVNLGRYPNWLDTHCQEMSEPYSRPQIDTLHALLQRFKLLFPNLRHIAGHEDLDRRLEPASDNPLMKLPRKRDPGPLFPWRPVLQACGLQRLVSDELP